MILNIYFKKLPIYFYFIDGRSLKGAAWAFYDPQKKLSFSFLKRDWWKKSFEHKCWLNDAIMQFWYLLVIQASLVEDQGLGSKFYYFNFFYHCSVKIYLIEVFFSYPLFDYCFPFMYFLFHCFFLGFFILRFFYLTWPCASSDLCEKFHQVFNLVLRIFEFRFSSN